MNSAQPRRLLYAFNKLLHDPLFLRGRHRRRQPLRCRLWLEPLEDRTLPSVSITGTIFNDLNADGARQSNEAPVAAAVAYLDANHNGQLDQQAAFHFDGQTALSVNTAFGGKVTPNLQLSGLVSNFTDLKVNLNVSKTSTGSVQVFLVGPAGLANNGNGGNQLLTLGATGVTGSFSGTLDDAATLIVPTFSSTNASVSGTYRPTGPFNNPSAFDYNSFTSTGGVTTDALNGGWFLFFASTTAAITVNSWSLEFVGSEQSATSDANGNYSFNNLVNGTYTVNVAGSSATRSVSTTSAGVDLGIAPRPDLAATSVHATNGTDWGSDVTVSYTVVNKGAGDAAASSLEIRLSKDGIIDGTDTLLATLTVPALAAGASVTGTTTVHLPGSPGSPPSGFSTADAAFLGLVVNAGNAVQESNTKNNSNQGSGIDLAPAVAFANKAVTSSPSVQVNPSVAVDPANSQHLVMAYTDYSLTTTHQYGGIGIAESFNGGQSWTYSSLPPVANFDGAADFATVKFDNAGNLFVSFMALTYLGANKPGLAYPDSGNGPDGNLQRSYAMQANNGIFVAKATRNSDGSIASWSTTAVVTNTYTPGGPKVKFDALPSLAVDTFGTLASGASNPRAGTLYLTWTRAYPTGSYPGGAAGTAGTDILLATSTDHGATWTVQVRSGNIPVLRGTAAGDIDTTTTQGGGIYNFSKVTVAPTGDVFVGYLQSTRFRVVRLVNATPTSSAFNFTFTYSAATVGGEPFPSDTLTLNAPDYGSATTKPFRNNPVFNITADPVRPGVLYAVEVAQTKSSDSTPVQLDQGDIYFARSTNNGTSWQRLFSVGGSFGNVNSYPASDISQYRTSVNDDNGSDFLRKTTASGAAGEETSIQAAPRLFVDGQGNIIIAWYDTRRDPTGKKYDVYAAVSTDGGQTFSANFRVTDATFDPRTATFTDPSGQQNDTLGDFLSIAAANGTAYLTWAGTQNGSQDIFFDRVAIKPAEASLNDRYEPNDTVATAADLGSIAGKQTFVKLVAAGGDVDFYKVTPAANGTFLVTVSATSALVLEAYDANGSTLLAQGATLTDGSGNVIGQQLLIQNTVANQPLLLKVSGVPAASASVPYSLTLVALTKDFGTAVTGSDSNSVTNGGADLYAVTAPVTGTFVVTLTGGSDVSGGNLVLAALNDKGTTTLQTGSAGANGTGTVTVSVTEGQTILLRVAGANPTTHGSFSLQFNARDQYQATPLTSLLIPISGSAPVTLAVGKVNDDGHADIVAANTDLTNPVSVLLNDGTGLFGAPQTYDGGTGSSTLVGGNTRTIALDDFNGDATLDVAMTNFASADVSVLLSHSDGTLGVDHRSDAVQYAGRVVVGDFNGDGHKDVVVLPATTVVGESPQVAVLIGRGDGTFLPPVLLSTGLPSGTTYGAVGDFDHDGKQDFAVFSANGASFEVYFGHGDGTFDAAITDNGPLVPRAVAAFDFNGDGKTDLVVGSSGTGTVTVLLSNGDGTFTPSQPFNANSEPSGTTALVIGFAIEDLGTVDGNGNSALGLPDGRKDLVVVTQPLKGNLSPQVNLLALKAAAPGSFNGFGKVQQIALGNFNGAVAAADFNGDGANDLALVDGSNVRVLYNQPLGITANGSQATARALGDVTHVITPKQVIAPGHLDAYFDVTVPTDAAGTGDQVVDISALFENGQAPGLQMEVRNAGGNVLASGQRLRLIAHQGAHLFIHVFAATDAQSNRGAGTYTLDIDVLPQIVSIEAQAPTVDGSGNPSGPVNSLVITLQGDRLDATAAQTLANYTVTPFNVSSPAPVMPHLINVVYNPDANTDVATSGRVFADSTRQTITLIFDGALPSGSYQITLSAALQTAAFRANEASLLVGTGFGDHPVVSVAGSQVNNGVTTVALGVVPAAGQADYTVFNHGTSFLTNFHDDMSTVLNSHLTQTGDSAVVSQAVLNQIIARFANVVGNQNFLVLVLDPVSIDMEDPNGSRATYQLQNQGSLNTAFANTIGRTFFDVGGNAEVMVIAGLGGTYNLNISDVPSLARGVGLVFAGGALIPANGMQSGSLTDAIRHGQRDFQFLIPEAVAAVLPQPGGGNGGQTAGEGNAGNGGATTSAGGFIFVGGLPFAGAASSGDQAAASLLITLLDLSHATTGLIGGTGDANSAAPIGGGGDGEPPIPDPDNPDRDNANPPMPQPRPPVGGAVPVNGSELALESIVPASQPAFTMISVGILRAESAARQPQESKAHESDQFIALALFGEPAASRSEADWQPAQEAAFVTEEPVSAGADEGGAVDPLIGAALFASGLCQNWWTADSDSKKAKMKRRLLHPEGVA